MKHSSPVYGAQIQGARNYQEDAFDIVELDSGGTLLVLCDGMGGHAGGAQASDIALNTFVKTFCGGDTERAIPAQLDTALKAANAALKAAAQAQPELSNMGTTLVAAHLDNGQLHWISVGDSPLFLLRDQTLTRLNANHSLAAVFDEMVKNGRMSAEEAASDPKRHSLRSSLSGNDIQLIDLPQTPFTLAQGDTLILASDGLETLSHQNIGEHVANASTSATSVVKALLAAVEQANAPEQDNTSTICYQHLQAAPAGGLPLKWIALIGGVLALMVVILAYSLLTKPCDDCETPSTQAPTEPVNEAGVAAVPPPSVPIVLETEAAAEIDTAINTAIDPEIDTAEVNAEIAVAIDQGDEKPLPTQTPLATADHTPATTVKPLDTTGNTDSEAALTQPNQNPLGPKTRPQPTPETTESANSDDSPKGETEDQQRSAPEADNQDKPSTGD